MQNRNILRQLRRTVALLELHEANPFKIRGYQNAILALEKEEQPLADMAEADLTALDGVGKSLAAKVYALGQTGTFPDLDDLLAQTPAGLLPLLDLKGIGPKKLRTLWQELGITNAEDLQRAGTEQRIAALKGFGAKTEQKILEALSFAAANADQCRLPDALALASLVEQELARLTPDTPAHRAGPLRRQCEVVARLQWLLATATPVQTLAQLRTSALLGYDPQRSGPFSFRGTVPGPNGTTPLSLEILLVSPDQLGGELAIATAAPGHLRLTGADDRTLLQHARQRAYADEAAVYAAAGWHLPPPEIREGLAEMAWLTAEAPPRLVELDDLKGILHVHSTYSDGQHTLAEMATDCRDRGFQYLGITDHSQAAFYANGLPPERVRAQHTEIDQLNAQLAPFRIFKGIEADILGDGRLDYDEDTLASFDFVVASVHTPLEMSEAKATERLLRAIAHPRTTMLGHPTGRLLLRRAGYPLDHRAVIDACAAHGVIIEINANPYRLDLDWRWLPYALEKGVLISLNPDAHAKQGYDDLRYGVAMGRKGGLPPDRTFNAWSAEEVAQHFAARAAR